MIYVELEPDLFACVEMQARMQYNRISSELLKGSRQKELEEKFEILRLFLKTADFNRLRSESEKHLVEGRRVVFTVHLEKGKPEYEMKVI
jgi:hypothetical protein